MKDLIAKLQIDANCALGAIWMHIDAQAARIAELEAQIADWAGLVGGKDGEIYSLRQQLAVASAHQADNTDKLWETLTDAQIEDIATDTGVSGWIIVFAREIERRVLASTALQAPVREVPGWISVDDRLPENDIEVLVWPFPTEEGMTASIRRGKDWGHMVWEDFKGWGWNKYDGPTHWQPIPAAPVQEPKP